MLITKTNNNGIAKNHKKTTNTGLHINYLSVQKQPREKFFSKSCSKIFCNLYRKTSVLEFLLNKRLHACNFIKKRLQVRCFPVNITKFLKVPLSKNIFEQLLLFLNPARYKLSLLETVCTK